MASPEQARALTALVIIAAVVTLLVLTGFGGTWASVDRPDVTVSQLPNSPSGVPDGTVGGSPESRSANMGRELGEQLVLIPRRVENRVAGYEISSDSPGDLLAKADLRAGDLLIEADGTPLDPARIQSLGDELASLDAVEVTYLRSGRMRKRKIRLTQ